MDTRQITKHALRRSQQRGVPKLVMNWLLDYGEECYDGRGGVLRFFTKTSIHKIRRDQGAESLARFSEYFRCYLVQSSSDGCVITVGKRYFNRSLKTR